MPDGLLRVKQNLLRTMEKGNAALVEGQAIEFLADPDALAAARAAGRNIFVPGGQIATYELGQEPMSGKLVLHLHGGGKQTFLFLVQDMDFEVLEAALRDWGATRQGGAA